MNGSPRRDILENLVDCPQHRRLKPAPKKMRNFLGINMDDRPTTRLRIPKLKPSQFSQVFEFAVDQFTVSIIRNHPTLDSLCPKHGWIFQVTSSEKHDVKGNHLAAFHSLFNRYLQTHTHVKFVFIVPPHRFREFSIQRIVNTAKRTDRTRPPPTMTVPWIEQYVMEMDATPMMTKFETAVHHAKAAAKKAAN